ncbi:MAG TPA: peptidylprolyl isomerase [Puia sp.]|nr:peptidylprolyl isomerase [Puia sp.]
MLKCFFFIILIINTLHGNCQPKSIAEIKMELEKSPNSPLYVKDIMKKKFILDTVVVTRTTHFLSLADSLAYRGILKKVYGPYTIQGKKFLVQILARMPNTFYKISQIFIDTSVFRYRIADSLGKSILSKLKNNQDSFERLAETYSMGGESITKGDLGWVARGSIIPAIDRQLAKTRKGDVFMVWSNRGLHIIKLTDGPKQDNGAALMMRVFL